MLFLRLINSCAGPEAHPSKDTAQENFTRINLHLYV